MTEAETLTAIYNLLQSLSQLISLGIGVIAATIIGMTWKG